MQLTNLYLSPATHSFSKKWWGVKFGHISYVAIASVTYALI